MIKDAMFAVTEQSGTRRPLPVITIPFSGQPNMETNEPLVFPSYGPIGVTHGLFIPGSRPNNMYEFEQISRDFRIQHLGPGLREHEVNRVTDPGILIGLPIVVMLAGVGNYMEGTCAIHRISQDDTELVFLNLLRGESDKGAMLVRGPTKFGKDAAMTDMTYEILPWKDVVAWAYLSNEGAIIKPKEDYPSPVELCLDCEFDDATKSLISVGVVDKLGHVHYAFDSKAAGATENQWIQENVNNVLFDVPPLTHVTDLNAKNITFAEWLTRLFSELQGPNGTNVDRPIIIHTDFPTDVAYISELMHLGMGKRIGSMNRVTFQIDYVDPYPTKLRLAMQHNAAWDAVALWYHLGFFQYAAFNHLMKKDLPGKDSPPGRVDNLTPTSQYYVIDQENKRDI